MDNAYLKSWREAHGLTQQEAAVLLGTTKTSYYRWESGYQEHIPTAIFSLVHLLQKKKNMRRLRTFLNIPLAQ